MLNERQKEAVNHIDWPLLMLAGAGAGKTHTLTERVANLVLNVGIVPESILCVTFTNKTAREMVFPDFPRFESTVHGVPISIWGKFGCTLDPVSTFLIGKEEAVDTVRVGLSRGKAVIE